MKDKGSHDSLPPVSDASSANELTEDKFKIERIIMPNKQYRSKKSSSNCIVEKGNIDYSTWLKRDLKKMFKGGHTPQSLGNIVIYKGAFDEFSPRSRTPMADNSI